MGGGLSCRFPLTLPDKKNTGDLSGLSALNQQLKAIGQGELTANQEAVRLGDIVIAWNVFQHFYPYFDVVGTDWDKLLTEIWHKTLSDQTEAEFYLTLRYLVAQLRDGHGGVYHQMSRQEAGFPFKVDWIEDQVVITASEDKEEFGVGEIIVSVDNIPAEEILLEQEKYISGSPQWKRVNALRRFNYRKKGTKATLVIRRAKETLLVEAERTHSDPRSITEPRLSDVEEIESGIFYVNLDRAEMPRIKGRMKELAKAKGVIFDLRGYPKGNHEVIGHLLTRPDTSTAWMRIPHVTEPDQENLAGFRESGWNMQPLKPTIEGKVVFLTDGRAISYAESFMGFIEHYKLAEIVGQPTAGTNGNINIFELPGGFRVIWTGMKVVKHDGSQHHLIGIQPTVPLQRTLRGVREGRDEFVEKALEIIKAN